METVYLFFAEGSEEVEALAVVDILRRAGVESMAARRRDRFGDGRQDGDRCTWNPRGGRYVDGRS